MRKRQAGFTLIEVLVVVALASVTFLAVTASLIQGIKIFDRLDRVDGEQEIAFLLERITTDLRNSASYSQVARVSSPDSISFASFSSRNKEVPSEVSYFLDAKTNRVVRTERDFPYKDKGDVDKLEILGNQIRSLTFEFSSEDSNVPVRITVSVEKMASPTVFKKQLLIPTGYVAS